MTLASTPLVPRNFDPDENDGRWQTVRGLGSGICDSGVGTFDGVVAVGRGARHVATNDRLISVTWRLLAEGESFAVGERERIVSSTSTRARSAAQPRSGVSVGALSSRSAAS